MNAGGTSAVRSRTATLTFDERAGATCLVKAAGGWSDADASAVVDAFDDWRCRVAHVDRVQVPRAWVEGPPASVVMEFLEGVDLQELLRSGAATSEHLELAGRALAAYHDAGDDRDAAERHLKRTCPFLPVTASLRRAIKPVRSAGDFAPHNVRVLPGGRIGILDPEVDPPVVTMHRDLAWFLWWSWRRGPVETAPFLDGYTDVSGVALERIDHRIIEMFCASFTMSGVRRDLRRNPSPTGLVRSARYRGSDLLGYTWRYVVNRPRSERPTAPGQMSVR